MRFKMPFETEDSSRISWFMGTISAAQVADPVRRPNSPWRLLQVAWDEPDFLQDVKRVSPWLVEVASNMPSVHLTPFSPPRKKLRLPQHPDFLLLWQFPVLQHSEFPSAGHFPFPPFANNLLGTNCPFPAGIQGARRGHFNKLQSDLFPVKFRQLSKAPGPDTSSNFPSNKCQENDDRCCSLMMGRDVPEKNQ
uniref:Auxin response factor domain-containing protein n=1 Tax=Kalanchoe fedtschenkoi TaxID=63787 RepID=A0A7N0TCL7_KALFE